MTEPAFRGGDEPAGDTGALPAGEFPDDQRSRFSPRERGGSGRELVRGRKVEARGEERLRTDLAWTLKLRDRKVGDGRVGSIGHARIGDGAIAGAKIDTDDEIHETRDMRPETRDRS